VFEGVVLPDRLRRQLALLADWHETAPELVGDRSTEDEAARLDSGDKVDRRAGFQIWQDQGVDRPPQPGRVRDQRGDVAEYDAGFRMVGDGPDQPLELEMLFAVHRCHPQKPDAPRTRPATASSRDRSSGSRACGAVIMAKSSARSEPMGHGSCSRGKSRARRITSACACAAFSFRTRTTAATSTWPCWGC